MTAAIVDLQTFSDADYSQAFQYAPDDVPFDFGDPDKFSKLLMMVRKSAEDAEVFISLDSAEEETLEEGGIDVYEDDSGDWLFAITISRVKMQQRLRAGEYVYSVILVRPDGTRDDIMRGTLTHSIGPTR